MFFVSIVDMYSLVICVIVAPFRLNAKSKGSKVLRLRLQFLSAVFPNFDFPIHPEEFYFHKFSQFYHSLLCLSAVALSVVVTLAVIAKICPKSQTYSSGRCLI